MTTVPPEQPDVPDDVIQRLLANRRDLLVDSSSQFGTGFPSARELAETVAFAPMQGNIWLFGRRYLLMQGAAFGQIRRELVNGLGLEKARGIYTRTGWHAGARLAEQVAKQWPEGDHDSLFAAGPRLNMLEGMVNVEPIRFEIDSNAGLFYAEMFWHNSLEAQEHIAHHGSGSDCVCWMQTGFASGYASALLGRMVVFRETECRANGYPACRIVGKPAEQWNDLESDTSDPEADIFFSHILHGVPEPDGYDESSEQTSTQIMVGSSAAFVAAQKMLQRVAPTQATVLLTGESGVGKELFAQYLHRHSSRKQGPLVTLNCASLPEHLVEAELFGAERGAYTGADRTRPGRFERANGGTLFLDEIASLSLDAQSKILRALQEGEIERVGGDKPIRVNVRLVAAANVQLRDEVQAGRFREDLFYRLNVYPIHIPSLRDRRDDIPELMEHFLRRYCQRHTRNVVGFTSRLVNTLLTHPFAGNIRELQNLIERGVISCDDGEAMDLRHIALNGDLADQPVPLGLTAEGKLTTPFPAEAKSNDTARPKPRPLHPAVERLNAFLSGSDEQLQTSLEEIEQLLVSQALNRTAGNVTAAAQLIGMSRAQVNYRLKGK
ncbi:sigma-54-dependent Fis family transcriptional regulator [Pseudomonas saliphila]|uniref:sigma-54-dependent Fis family transcriptional regulator n=1 Tax=Pseudomonas saliphila TaxID=2586906 RepID=UPI00123C6380|nr:sigma-54-dependent Fis family transcriptional regulator [Pseudomonas saliphila]